MKYLPTFQAYHKQRKIWERVLLICFVNRYVDVLPERNLEGGSQETWYFDEIELWQQTDRVLTKNEPLYDQLDLSMYLTRPIQRL